MTTWTSKTCAAGPSGTSHRGRRVGRPRPEPFSWLIAARIALLALLVLAAAAPARGADEPRTYRNALLELDSPRPILADYPQYVAPVRERRRFAAPAIVDEAGADLHVSAWRFSYNARGIIEMPNHLDSRATAVIVVHPWGIDDGQGWKTPEPAGVADFCTPEKNKLAGEHTRDVINPFLKSLRGRVAGVIHSLPGPRDPIRSRLYRSLDTTPSAADRREAAAQLDGKLRAFSYRGEPLPEAFALSRDTPVVDYFRQFPGLDAGPRYNNAGFWELPIPVTRDLEVAESDVVAYDAEGYAPLREYLKREGVRHVLLTGYATDMCFCRTAAGYENLSQDFNVFLVGDATLATFPANDHPAYATNAAISLASLNHLVTQISWIALDAAK